MAPSLPPTPSSAPEPPTLGDSDPMPPLAIDIEDLEQARRDARVRDLLAAAAAYGERTMQTVPPRDADGTPRLDATAREPARIEGSELRLARRDVRVRRLLKKARDYGRGLERR